HPEKGHSLPPDLPKDDTISHSPAYCKPISNHLYESFLKHHSESNCSTHQNQSYYAINIILYKNLAIQFLYNLYLHNLALQSRCQPLLSDMFFLSITASDFYR